MERRRLDELHQHREVRAGNPGEGGADGKGEQRVGSDVDAQALGANRVVAQGGKGAAPGRGITHHSSSARRMVEPYANQKNAAERSRLSPKNEGRWMPEMPKVPPVSHSSLRKQR